MKFFGLVAVTAGLAITSPVQALCMYNGELYAKTTLEQEFRDSRWVAKVRVASATNHASDDGDVWVLYDLEVLEAYKGKPAKVLTFFTERNSGAFYFDLPLEGADLGGEYLVFLNPNASYAGQREVERDTVFVNYSCGQSKPWREVTAEEQRRLVEPKGTIRR